MTDLSQPATERRAVPLAAAVVGMLILIATFPLGPQATLGGAIALLVACLLGLRDITVPVFTWPNAAAGLILIVWLIPIRTYDLPVDLPFQLEPYRLFLLALVFAWVVGVISGHARLSADGQANVLIVFCAVLFATQILNFQEVNAGTTEPEAVKSLSYFLSFVIAFLLVTSTVDSLRALEKLIRILVGAGTFVALTAIYDSRFSYNVFEHLHEWIPLLEFHPRDVVEERGGRLRVFGSAQHPIALSVALGMMIPLGLYLVQRATTVARARLWAVAATICLVGALATVSRTLVVMGVIMVMVALWLRPQALARFWPMIFVLPVVVHFVAPGALGGLFKAFFPKEGLVSSLQGRAGAGGSGRFADYGPGFQLWIQAPLLGTGIGEQTVPSDLPPGATSAAAETGLIFDNQYLNTLVTTGFLGLVVVLWFVWGSLIKLFLSARRRLGHVSDLVAACAVSVAGFGASMFLFDALYFVQCTLLFFLIAAIGFRARSLSTAVAD